jgi:hypothetical protein
MEQGLNLSLLCQELFASRIGGFFGLDVLISAIVLVLFIATGSRRTALPLAWLPIVGTSLVSVSLGFHFFFSFASTSLTRSRAR